VNALRLFLPCAGGAEGFLADEVHRLTGLAGDDLTVARGGVVLRASWRDAMLLNLRSRLAQRVLLQLAHGPYRNEGDLYALAQAVAWDQWFTTKQTFKVEITAQHSPLKSLNFAALKIKDAIADRFRDGHGARPSVDTQWPDVRVYAHLTSDHATLYMDTSGEPLFKRGWREDKGEAPLKETLAAAMIAASGWQADAPLYDPCCGSGTIAIEAAQLACGIAPGILRRFAFEKLIPFDATAWRRLREEAKAAEHAPTAAIFGSDVAFRMVDFARRNAERAGVAQALNLRGGDALQRMPPSDTPGVMLVNPPYGERIEAAGIAGRERAQSEGGDFFAQLAAHWKAHYAGWTAWVLVPDMKLPSRMRLKESRRVPMWNGPIECRLFRFDMVRGSARKDV
jgi:putative N6-adenine-specific DNA methylase